MPLGKISSNIFFYITFSVLARIFPAVAAGKSGGLWRRDLVRGGGGERNRRPRGRFSVCHQLTMLQHLSTVNQFDSSLLTIQPVRLFIDWPTRRLLFVFSPSCSRGCFLRPRLPIAFIQRADSLPFFNTAF